MTSKETVKELQRLEREICKGLHAYDKRNALVCEMVANGIRQADVARAINEVRSRMNSPQITPDAVAATIKRVQRKAS
jgi:hypothetical protein